MTSSPSLDEDIPIEGLSWTSQNSWKKHGEDLNWLVVSTHLKNMSQIGSFPQVKIKKNETTT